MELQEMTKDPQCGTYIWEISFQFITKRSLTIKEYDNIEEKIRKLLYKTIK